MKNQKGITLIALVITIIVLLILAGITIAMLTGENGLLNKANAAKAKDIEASVDEQVRMGAAAMRLEIAKEAATNPAYDARKNTKTLGDALLKDLQDTSGKKEATDWKVTPTPDSDKSDATSGSFLVEYTGKDYTNARNKTDAKISYTITLSQQGVTVPTSATITP